MRIRVLVLFLLFPLLLIAQKKVRPGKAPFRATFNYVKLADALTDSLMTDEQKVRSIFLWMTKHIRYGAAIEDPNAILFWRSAVCLGYSILFDSLCKVAGVQSHIVVGYAYEPWAEAMDTLFIDNHAWNAVMIDGEWKLIDVTWSRGYMKYQKDPLRKLWCKLTHIPFVPHYKFKKKQNENYYLAPPERFILDHYPSTAAWQILPCAVPIDSFQKSHYSTINYLENPVNCHNWDDSIEPIVNAFQYNQHVVNGYQAVHLNPKNHQDLAYGMWQAGRYRAIRAEDTLMWWQKRIQYYDTTIAYLDTLVKMYRKMQKDEAAETKFLVRRNARMKRMTESETKPILKKQPQEMALVRKTIFMTYKQRIRIQREIIRLRRQTRSFRKMKLHIERPAQDNPAQDKMHADLVERYNTSQEGVDEHISNMHEAGYYRFAWEGPYNDSLVRDKKRWLNVQKNDMKEVLYARGVMNLNAFDTLVYTRKKEVVMAQHYQDSLQLLMRDVGKWRMDSAYTVAKNEATLAKMAIKLSMSNLKIMGKLPAGGIDEKAEFRKCKEQVRAINDSLIEFNKERLYQLKLYRKQFKRIKWKRYILRHRLRQELQSEKWRFAGWRKFFIKRGRVRDKACRDAIIAVEELKRAEKSRKKALIRKVRKWEKEHAKLHRKTQKELLKKKELIINSE